jgi:beta-catenin-like protein 1
LRLLNKYDDNNDDERKSIMKCLNLIENLLEVEPATVANKLMQVDNFIDWLILFLEKGNPSSDNYLQSAELLFTIISESYEDYKVKFTKILNGMERILGILNTYRKKTLELEEEHEALVNLTDAICSLLMVEENLEVFRKLQGFELLFSLLKK